MMSDREDVVDDRDRQHEQLHARRDAVAEQREHADGERDVRRGRDRPARRLRCARGDRQEDERGEHHAAEGGEDGQRRGAPVAQLAADELAFDLQADDEEEDRHQAVVDPVAQIEVQRDITGPEPQDVRPRGRVLVACGVGPQQRGNGRDGERDAAGSLVVQELRERVDDDPLHAGALQRRRERSGVMWAPWRTKPRGYPVSHHRGVGAVAARVHDNASSRCASARKKSSRVTMPVTRPASTIGMISTR